MPLQMPLQGPSRTARATAALSALLMVAALLFLLRGGGPGSPRATSPTVSVLVIPAPFVRPRPEAPRPLVARERNSSRPQAQPMPPDTMPALATPSGPPTPPVAPLAITLPPEPPASAPLDLGARSAIARSKGSARQMAEASGQVLDTPKTTAAQQLAGGIEQAGIEGCLSEGATKHEHPALAMGGLLAAPGLVVAALSGRCKP